jgi:hypothetical protein
MLALHDVIRQMTVNAQAIRSLMKTLSSEQANWKPDIETWSMTQVMDHVCNEERVDFRAHLKELFSTPRLAWGGLGEKWKNVDDCQKALKGFLAEREASLAWLKNCNPPIGTARSLPPSDPTTSPSP